MPQTVLETRHQGVMRPAARELRALFETGSLQAGVYIIGFLAGLAAIRLLPVQQFAYYTVANAMLGTLTVAADSGIAQAVLARGGALWQSPAALSGTLASGSLLRRRIALVGALAALPILFLLLLQQGASKLDAALISLSIVPVFVTTLSGHLIEVVLRLHQRVNALQLIQLRGAALRLAILLAALTFFPQAWLACVGAGVAQLWATNRTRFLARGVIDVAARPDPEATRDLRARMRRIAPSAIYYAFTGQINVWLLSFFGSASTVAEAGALGRLAMVFGVATAIVSLLYIPRFARLPTTSATRVRRTFWAAQGMLGGSIGAVVGLVWLFPSVPLALLGPHYATLTREVGLAVAGGGLGFLVASTQSFAAARGIVLAPTIIIPATMIIQVMLAILLPVSTLVGVLWFGVLANLALWVVQTLNFAFASRGEAQHVEPAAQR